VTTSRRPRNALGVLAGTVAVAALLAGCTSQPEPPPAPAPSVPAAEVPDTVTSETPVDLARAVFDRTAQQVLAAGQGGDGRAVVDALVAVGFDKASLQVTPDATWTGRASDSLQFSALRGDSCLVGQIAGDAYAAQTAPVLGTGACLIGTTRAIDW